MTKARIYSSSTDTLTFSACSIDSRHSYTYFHDCVKHRSRRRRRQRGCKLRKQCRKFYNQLRFDRTEGNISSLSSQAPPVPSTGRQLQATEEGILTAEDAIMCHNVGAKAIIVSNHGGRQLLCIHAVFTITSPLCILVAKATSQ
ncbi:hypothetical protein M8J77_017443 [Diaphorina citri]|nr:hypothetical protein M8J77_017443 [Diaphorina citri]